MTLKSVGILLALLYIIGGKTADATTVKMQIIKDADAPAGSFSYIIITDKRDTLPANISQEDLSKMPREDTKTTSLKKFTKKTTASFDDTNKDIRIWVWPAGNLEKKQFILKGDYAQTRETDLGKFEIRIDAQNNLRLAKKLGTTRKIAVVKKAPTKDKWTITASSIEDIKQSYGSVSIKEKTNPASGLPIPTEGDFFITVKGPNVKQTEPQKITHAEVPPTIKTIYIGDNGGVRFH